MRACVATLVVLLLGSAVGTATAADGTWFVVPGKRGIPVIVNPLGFDASYMIVEGDFGLDRPAQVNPIIVGGPHVLPRAVLPVSLFSERRAAAGIWPSRGRAAGEPPDASRRKLFPKLGRSLRPVSGHARYPESVPHEHRCRRQWRRLVGRRASGSGDRGQVVRAVRVRARVHTDEGTNAVASLTRRPTKSFTVERKPSRGVSC